ncbi:MAG: hypothetical protein WC201_02945, partial [Bacilli bacterium]
CSYGGTSVVSHSEFTTFYNEENLDNQQHYAFALGDGITINASSLDEEDNKISQSFVFSSSSISKWEENLTGGSLNFAYSMTKKKPSGLQLEGDKYSSSVSHNATSIIDNDNENIVNGIDSYIYKYNVDQVDGTETEYDNGEILTQTDSKTVTEYSEDYGITASITTTTWSSSISSVCTDVEYDSGSDITTTTSHEVTYNFQYDEIVPLVGASHTVLTYYNKVVDVIREEVLATDGSVISGTKTIATLIESTSFDSSSDNEAIGSRVNKNSLYNWVNNDYVKDEGSSTESTDDTYRYTLAQSYLDSLEASSFLSTWKTSVKLNEFLTSLSSYYDALFVDFDTYLAGDVANEEIVRDGLTYQYRSRLSEDGNNLNIIQYTFVKSSNEEESTKLTDVSLLLVDTLADEVTTLSRVSLVY